VNLAPLDAKVGQLTAELKGYVELRQALARADAMGLELPAGLLDGAKPLIGELADCARPECTNTFVAGARPAVQPEKQKGRPEGRAPSPRAAD
jgi:hypothetical protein